MLDPGCSATPHDVVSSHRRLNPPKNVGGIRPEEQLIHSQPLNAPDLRPGWFGSVWLARPLIARRRNVRGGQQRDEGYGDGEGRGGGGFGPWDSIGVV